MKTKKTKKILGGVAIAAVSLGCLGLAGIANADQTGAATGDSTSQTTFDNALPAEAITGTTTVTFNISAAQTKAGDLISQHNLKYVQIGAYIGHGTSFAVESMPAMKAMLTSFINATSGGLDSVFSSASKDYAKADNGLEDPLTWMLTGNSSGSFLGADPTGQASTTEDQAVRALANYLFSAVPSTDLTGITFATTGTNSPNGYSYGTWNAANPGIYLVVDTATNNVSMPMIVSTMPGGDYNSNIPSSMKNIVTDTVGLKNQDPSMTPDKNYVSGGEISSDTAATGYSTTIGPNNPVEYQVSNVFPNVQSYPSTVSTYTYSFNDYPEKGMTVEPSTLQVAGIPIATLMGEGATVTLKGQFGANQSAASSATSATKSYTGSTASLPGVLLGGSGVEMQVSLDVQALQAIQKDGKATTNTAGGKINNASFTQYSVTNPTADGAPGSTFGTDGNTMAGQAGQASSSSSKTDSAAVAKTDAGSASSTPLTGQKSWTGQTTPAQLFGMTYDAYLNSSVSQTTNGQTTGGTVEAGNTATTTSGGVTSSSTSSTPLTTNGGYNGSSTTTPNSTTNPSNGTAGTNTPSSVNPGDITHTDGHHNPTSQSTGAGINWMKIWADGDVATGAKFTVQQWTPTSSSDPATGTAGDWLAASASQGWSWVNKKTMADQFASVSGLESSNPAYGGLFEISGLASGYYLVSENTTATGADASVMPQFIVYLNPQGGETVTPYGTYKDLVNNTPDGNPFFSGMKGETAGYNTVENVKSISGLPMTGGAGILTGVIAAVLLFGTAGIVLVVYKRRKSQQD